MDSRGGQRGGGEIFLRWKVYEGPCIYNIAWCPLQTNARPRSGGQSATFGRHNLG